jgi:hypothetical protein
MYKKPTHKISVMKCDLLHHQLRLLPRRLSLMSLVPDLKKDQA